MAPPAIQDAVAAYAVIHGPGVNSSALWGASAPPGGYPSVSSFDVTPQQLASAPDVTATPDNAADAMVPTSTPPATAQLTTPSMADIAPIVPNGPSGAPALLNGIINNDPAAIQAASQQIAQDVSSKKVTQGQISNYFNNVPPEVASYAKDQWDANQPSILSAADAGFRTVAEAAAKKTVSGNPLYSFANWVAPTTVSDKVNAGINQGIDQANAGMKAGFAKVPSLGMSAWNVSPDNQITAANPSAQADTSAIYNSLNASVPSNDQIGSVAPQPVSPVAYAGGADFPTAQSSSLGTSDTLSSALAGRNPLTGASSVAPSPVAPASTTWGGSPTSDPLNAALAASNPDAALTPETGSQGISGVSFLVAPQPPPVQSSPPPSSQNNQATVTPVAYRSVTPAAPVSYNRAAQNSGPGYGLTAPISTTNAWSGGNPFAFNTPFSNPNDFSTGLGGMGGNYAPYGTGYVQQQHPTGF
jgi:hypothetical protein